MPAIRAGTGLSRPLPARRARYRQSIATSSIGRSMPLSSTDRRPASLNAAFARAMVSAEARISFAPAAAPMRAARFTPLPM